MQCVARVRQRQLIHVSFMFTQWRRAHWARSGLGPTFNPAGRARSGQVRLFSRLVLNDNNYFDQLNFTFDCYDYIAVTHNRN